MDILTCRCGTFSTVQKNDIFNEAEIKQLGPLGRNSKRHENQAVVSTL